MEKNNQYQGNFNRLYLACFLENMVGGELQQQEDDQAMTLQLCLQINENVCIKYTL